MTSKYVLFPVFIYFVLMSSFAAASNWILFAAQQRDGSSWYYDKETLDSSSGLKIIGLKIPVIKGNIRETWIKSSGDKGEKLYRAELSCNDGLARLRDDNGKTIYSDVSLNYLYDRPIPPDSVLDMLREAVCH